MPTLRTLPIVLAASAALVAAGCGSSDDKTTSSSASSAATSTGSSSSKGGGDRETVKTTHGSLGTFLTDEEGRTMYLFEKDKGPKSTCSGACAAAWPPVTTSGAPKAEGGVRPALLSTSMRSDGTTQVVYNGHPLYYFAGDQKPGQTTGQGLDRFGAEWYVLTGAGDKLEGGEDHGGDKGSKSDSSDSSSGGSSSGSSSGGGYSSAY